MYHTPMLKLPLSFIIGLRYTRAKRRNHFVSFISFASLLGIALGVTVLITVLSVMNGFNEQIRARFFAITPAVTIVTKQDMTNDWGKLVRAAQTLPTVMAAAPYVSGNGMIMHGTQFAGVSLMGILPNEEQAVSQLNQHLVEGDVQSLQAGQYHVIVGKMLAESLNLHVGDTITVLTPQSTVTLVGILPRYKTFKITGVYHTTGGLYDSSQLFINMKDAETLFLPASRESGVHLRLHNLYDAPAVTHQLQLILPPEYGITNWTLQFGAFFQALAMEKTMLFVILLLIIGVAAFNLVSTLVMVVNDKRADIAILRTLGARPRTIMMTFIVQGTVIGLLGTLLGLLGGVALASSITAIADWLQRLLHVQFVQSSVFFIDYLPSKIEIIDVIEVCCSALLLSIVATIYPAILAFKTEPAEALRYE